jgi:hypothetical protein
MFWIDKGPGINNIKAGFKPKLIIKFKCLYFHHTQEREFHIPDLMNGSFDKFIEVGTGYKASD